MEKGMKIDPKEIQELTVTAANRLKRALEKGDESSALDLLETLDKEIALTHKRMVYGTTTQLIPLMRDMPVKDQDRLTEKLRAAAKRGDREEALGVLEKKVARAQLINDIAADFMGDLLEYLYDALGKQELWDFFRGWGEDSRQWFEKAAHLPLKERVKFMIDLAASEGSTVRVEEVDENHCRLILEPCGTGGRRIGMERERGCLSAKGLPTRVGEGDLAVTGERANVPVYCTHCLFMFETLCREWTGEPLWRFIPPRRPGDPCVWEVRGD